MQPQQQALPQYNQDYYPGEQQQEDGDYEYGDLPQSYGSIIKELTDTAKIVDDFELRLRGKTRDKKGEVVDDPRQEAYIKSDKVARDFTNILRSHVNLHVDFSYFDAKEVASRTNGAILNITRWLMLQGDDIPQRYRHKISHEALNLIDASYHKALEGKMLKWTKGSFREGRNVNEMQGNNKGFMDYIFPFARKKQQ